MFGALSDRVGRRPVYLFGAIATAVTAYPLFFILDTGSTPLIWVMLVVAFLTSHAAMYAPQSQISHRWACSSREAITNGVEACAVRRAVAVSATDGIPVSPKER